MRNALIAGLVGGLVVGCYATLDSFDRRMAKLGCINAKECSPDDFNAVYDSVNDCRDDVKADLDELFAGCTYNAKIGRKCVHAFYRLRKDCSVLDGTQLPECEGALTCTSFNTNAATLGQQILHGFVSPGPGAPDNVPLDTPFELDPELDDAIEALE